MQRTENKLTPKDKGKLKVGLENFTEHRKRHYENRRKEYKYRITSPSASGGGACSGSTFASGGFGESSAFSGVGGKAAGKQLELARERAEQEELGPP